MDSKNKDKKKTNKKRAKKNNRKTNNNINNRDKDIRTNDVKKNNTKTSNVKKDNTRKNSARKNDIKNYEQKNIKKHKKTNKRKKKKRHLVRLFIPLLLIAIATVFAMVSPVFSIQEINVYGNEKVNTETILSLSGLQIGKNIFQNIKSDIISNIKENTYIEEVTIKRVLPGTIEITVNEREIAYQVNVINSYVYINYEGYILETSSKDGEVPLISGLATSQDTLLNGQRLESEDITKLNTILKIVDNAKQLEIYDLITEIIIDENEYILYLKDEKKYIYLGDDSNITNKMMYAEIIIGKEKGNEGYAMINGDLEDGFNPYFREEDID